MSDTDAAWRAHAQTERERNALWVAAIRASGVLLLLAISAYQGLVVGLEDWRANLPIFGV